VQPLDATDERALFEGEFAPAELGQYLGGLDPMTPLFGKYLAGIVMHDEGAGVYRLDVGLGDAPARAGALVEDQRKVARLVAEASRFKVVLHAAAPTRPVLVQVGPAPEAGFFTIALAQGQPSAEAPRARALPDKLGIAAGPISAVVEPDGTVLLHDAELALAPVRINELVDEGDRGDLYHFDPAGVAVRPKDASVEVTEAGPLRARLRIVQRFDLPVGLDDQRRGRAGTTHPMVVITEVTLVAGERRVEVCTALDNAVCDHRLRAIVHAPFRAERIDVEHGLAVVRRPLDPGKTLGHGTERAAPTSHHQGLMSRGLPEHEVLPEGEGTRLALTLLRAVGWLSRGDLSVIEHAAGPIVQTPGAEELGPHRFEYAVLLHRGNWQEGAVYPEARRYAAPAMAVRPTGRVRAAAGVSLVETSPSCVAVQAAYPARDGRGLIVRLLNASAERVVAVLRPATRVKEARSVDPLEQPLDETSTVERAQLRDGAVQLPLGPWQIATVRLC
jgi:hypothetical protein